MCVSGQECSLGCRVITCQPDSMCVTDTCTHVHTCAHMHTSWREKTLKEENTQERECDREKKKQQSDREKDVQLLRRESVFPNPLLGCLSQTGARELEQSQDSVGAQGKTRELSPVCAPPPTR